MPDEVFKDVEAKPAAAESGEAELVTKLLALTDNIHNPWRQDYIGNTVVKCNNYAELRQWSAADEAKLSAAGIPALTADRINRGIETIIGIKDNTGSSSKVQKREFGDERIADLLDDCKSYAEYCGDFDSVRDEVFEAMLKPGIGIRKVLFDQQAKSGQGEIWAEAIPIENFWYSNCKKKTLKDITWAAHLQMMDWEDAMMLAPEKAGALKGLKATLQTEWDAINKGSISGSNDYDKNNPTRGGASPRYPDQVNVYDIWTLRRIPISKVSSLQVQQDAQGNIINLTPQVREEAIDYVAKPEMMEEIVARTVKEEWHQFVIACGNEKKHGLLLQTATDDDHPFVGTCAERKKRGDPRGFVEIAIPHQDRINVALTQKIGFNIKALKTTVAIRGITNVDSIVQQSALGSVLVLPQQATIDMVNTVPPLNIEAIEEGNIARQDLDFAAAATEMPLRGMAQPSSSGIQLSLQQNAAITPISKWVKALHDSEREFGRKVLRLIIKNYKDERISRIVGMQKFFSLTQPTVNQMTGQVISPPVIQIDPATGQPVPLSLDIADYDVVIEDKSVSDMAKQQSFNAIEALVQGGVPMDDTYRIKNSPIKDVDAALESNQKQRQDIIMSLMGQVQQLEAENQALTKLVPKENKPLGMPMPKKQNNQRANGRAGANASQAGPNSMLGGSLGIPA